MRRRQVQGATLQVQEVVQESPLEDVLGHARAIILDDSDLGRLGLLGSGRGGGGDRAEGGEVAVDRSFVGFFLGFLPDTGFFSALQQHSSIDITSILPPA